GPNVNLGNIPQGEVLALEDLRVGLRSDTLQAVCHGGAPAEAPAARALGAAARP
ncbi:MAG: phosphosulfolactate synthase, partial [Firmicutes bacterium]|nr:phosphosulfolactate synthase [Bacillota bacterium]